ncbi:MAG: hypothetical protein ACJAV7_002343, partial [Flavobacteriales bacterium]
TSITKQIVSLQIFWTIISSVIFLLSPFIPKLFSSDLRLTLPVLIVSILVNIFIILRNAVEIDKKNELYIKLNFSLI